MMRTVSLNNHGDMRHGLRLMLFDLRRHIGLGSIFAALMFLAMPFAVSIGIQTMNLNSSMFNESRDYLSNPNVMMPLVYFGYAMLILLSILAVIIIPAILFKYMDNKRSVDLYHSIPVSRTSLFFSHYFSGLLLVLIPTLFAFLCTILARFIFNAPGSPLPTACLERSSAMGFPSSPAHFSDCFSGRSHRTCFSCSSGSSSAWRSALSSWLPSQTAASSISSPS